MDNFDLEAEVRALAANALETNFGKRLTAHYEVDMQYAETPQQKVRVKIEYLKNLLDLIDVQSRPVPKNIRLTGLPIDKDFAPPPPPQNPGYYTSGGNKNE